MKSASLWMMAALAVLLVFLASCSQPNGTLNAQSLAEEEKQVVNPSLPEGGLSRQASLCANLTCAKDQVCIKNKCQCLEGFKSCAGSCIPQSACCSDKNCQSTETCINSQCQFSCSRVICPTNQVCDESQKRCTCPSDYRLCEVQNKCIPADFCCDKFDCGRGLICTATVNSARVCLYTKTPSCKYFGDKDNKLIALANNQTFDVTAAEFLYGKKVKLIVAGKPFVLENGAREVLEDSITLSVEDIREIGGKCRAPKEREKL